MFLLIHPSNVERQLLTSAISDEEMEQRLAKEEEDALKVSGRAPLHSTSASAFLAMGLELEESQ